jgi:stage V sporulation protein B
MKRALIFAAITGVFAFLLTAVISKPLALHWLKDIRVLRPLRILAICLPMAAISSVINGYFSAVRRVYKNAFSQTAEMTVKIVSTVSLFSFVFVKDAELACILLVCGSVISETVAFVINIILYLFDCTYHLSHFSAPREDGISKRPNGSVSLSAKILSIAMPVALTSYIRSALIAIEHSLIPKGLKKFGASSSQALSSYGTLVSMALPVINFPYALIGPFSALLIPEIAESRTREEKRHVKYIAHRAFQTSITFAICISGMFFIFSKSLGLALYGSEEAARYIRLLAPLIPIMYTDSVTDAILKGMGEQFYAMKVNIADALISVTLVYFLVPIYGIYGYIITIYAAEIINTALSIRKMIKVTSLRPPVVKFIIGPLLSAVGSFAVLGLLRPFFNFKEAGLIVGILTYIAVYIFFLACLGVVSKEDFIWLRKIFLYD